MNYFSEKLGAEAEAEAEAEVGAKLSRLRIVLVGTSHPGNIGAVARAMKVMGLDALHLVNPVRFPAIEATARAVGASDLLDRALVHSELEHSVEGCSLVYGTTARNRQINWPVLSPRDAALEISRTEAPVAIVFGREQAGLSNSELDLCQRSIRIPTHSQFKSLNLGQAVQIMAYEIRMAHLSMGSGKQDAIGQEKDPLASASEIQLLRAHLMAVMKSVGYYDPAYPKLLERRIGRYLNSTNLRHSEVQIVRGFLSAIEQRLGFSAL